MKEENEEQYDSKDSLSLFHHDINKIPMLSREEEVSVAQRARAGDQAAIDLLIESNLRFVRYVVFKCWRPGLQVPRADLISDGCLAMVHAAKSFDPDFGVRFITYAYPGIIQHVRRRIMLDYEHRKSHKSLDEPVYGEDDETTYKDLLISSNISAEEIVLAGRCTKCFLTWRNESVR